MQISSEKDRRSRIAPMQADIAVVIERHTRGVADCATPIPELSLFRREAPARPAVCMVEPSIVMVAQGTKRLLVGGEGYVYDAERFLVTSLDLPANSEVIAASVPEPCVGLVLKLDIRLLAELIAQAPEAPPRERSLQTSVGVGSITPALLEPIARLLALLDEPAAIPVLAPLIQREIHYRLLATDQAPRLRQIASVGSQSHRVARAIDWLKLHYAEAAAHRGPGSPGPDERLGPAPPLPAAHRHEPAAVPEVAAAERSAAPDAQRWRGSRDRGIQRRLREPVAVQPRVRTAVRRATAAGRRGAAARAVARRCRDRRRQHAIADRWSQPVQPGSAGRSPLGAGRLAGESAAHGCRGPRCSGRDGSVAAAARHCPVGGQSWSRTQ